MSEFCSTSIVCADDSADWVYRDLFSVAITPETTTIRNACRNYDDVGSSPTGMFFEYCPAKWEKYWSDCRRSSETSG